MGSTVQTCGKQEIPLEMRAHRQSTSTLRLSSRSDETRSVRPGNTTICDETSQPEREDVWMIPAWRNKRLDAKWWVWRLGADRVPYSAWRAWVLAGLRPSAQSFLGPWLKRSSMQGCRGRGLWQQGSRLTLKITRLAPPNIISSLVQTFKL